MNLDDLKQAAPPTPPCAACGVPSDTEAWDVLLCWLCWGRWHREAGVTVAEVEQALPATVEPQPGTPAHVRWSRWWGDARAAEWTRRTRAWLALARAERVRGAA
ncbi:MAG: hypothetical protein SFW67_35630 [Myxococcaceae bacterium]|nr:hypothetical protein [Myxococcaceae bacterium]